MLAPRSKMAGASYSGGRRWILSLLPYALASGPLSTLVTLQVKDVLGGGSVQVSQVVASGTAAGVAASLAWGEASDRVGRREVLLAGLLGFALSTMLLSASSSLAEVAVLYSLANFFASAVGVASSLLVMDVVEKRSWNRAFSDLNYLLSVGYLAGDAAAALMAADVGVRRIVLMLGSVGAASAALAVALVPAPRIALEREAVVRHREAFISRLRALPTAFLRPPSLSTFKPLRLLRAWGTPAAKIPVLYLAAVAFFVSSGVFNTLYPYGLAVKGLTSYEVLAVMSAGMVAQIAGFYLAPRLAGLLGDLPRSSALWLSVRSLSYVTIGLTAWALGSRAALLTGFTAYPLAAGIAYASFYTALNLMVFEVVQGSGEGRGLGLYSTLTGAAYFAGSLLSGYLAEWIGIGQTYVVAGAMLAASIYLMAELSRIW